MSTDVSPVPLDAIRALRDLYREEMSCQIVHDSLHERGLTDCYAVSCDDQIAGYGCLSGSEGGPRRTIKEFFVRPAFRDRAEACFRALIATSGALRIEAQTNDRQLLPLARAVAGPLDRQTILFADSVSTALRVPDATFRRVAPKERGRVFRHTSEPVGDWGLEKDGEIVATGGLMLHYNPPYADIYMEVAAGSPRHGFGSYLVQELKRVCYEMGRVPAARCRVANLGSRAALEKAGMAQCGFIVHGQVRDIVSGESTR
jgi:GNAT superfamily N-acetyltransferase